MQIFPKFLHCNRTDQPIVTIVQNGHQALHCRIHPEATLLGTHDSQPAGILVFLRR